VAPFVEPDQRGRAYGLFYTSTLLATASAPVIYGAIADIVGLTGSFAVLGTITLAIVPLAHRWRRAFDGAGHQAVTT
jgi:MFS family permease